MAWQNRNRSMKQMCFMCYGERYNKSRTYYVKYTKDEKKGVRTLGIIAKWRRLQENYWGAPPSIRMRKILERLSRLWQSNRRHSENYLSLEKVYKMMTQEFTLSKAADFIVHFGISGMGYCCPFLPGAPY